VANGINQVCTSKLAQGHALQAALEAGGVEFIEENGGRAAYDCESRHPKK